jgi:hypothetical protein
MKLRQMYDNPYRNPAGIFFLVATFPIGFVVLCMRVFGYNLCEEKLANFFAGDL